MSKQVSHECAAELTDDVMFIHECSKGLVMLMWLSTIKSFINENINMRTLLGQNVNKNNNLSPGILEHKSIV